MEGLGAFLARKGMEEGENRQTDRDQKAELAVNVHGWLLDGWIKFKHYLLDADKKFFFPMIDDSTRRPVAFK